MQGEKEGRGGGTDAGGRRTQGKKRFKKIKPTALLCNDASCFYRGLKAAKSIKEPSDAQLTQFLRERWQTNCGCYTKSRHTCPVTNRD